MKYWLMKSEPSDYCIDDLKVDKKTLWTGVRNYQARNFMIHEMGVGDLAFFYNSNGEPSGITGVMKITRPATADPTQFDSKSKYFEERARPEKAVWECVEVSYLKSFKKILALGDLKKIKGLEQMEVLKRGSRLSIQPVKKTEFEKILKTLNESLSV
jgi:predicted RNA-binding protein with PUA-like domain